MMKGLVLATLAMLWLAATANATPPKADFVDATEQRLFIMSQSIEEKPGLGDRIDVQVYAIIVNACNHCAETYVFVETRFHRGNALGAFECNYQFRPLETFSNGLRDFLCAREDAKGKVTGYRLSYTGEKYVRVKMAE